MKFSAVFFSLVVVMFVGIMTGINVAQSGIERIEGAPYQSTKAFQIKKVDQGKIEVEVFGRQVNGENRVLAVYPGNLLTNIGSTMRDWVTTNTRQALEWLMKKL
ncbi:DUF3679 domain-containing protein [Aneurinibacillus terranovensis]|uniref:DUF3679 domain-containing protein n=1 Tax=Aneurinibacillus terranovensis TaxID=278991 RepID=UPI0003F8C8B1|nr:DUF3679 domain-containing protein [Aneurinibacillus terranovensis]